MLINNTLHKVTKNNEIIKHNNNHNHNHIIVKVKISIDLKCVLLMLFQYCPKVYNLPNDKACRRAWT